MEVRTVDDVKLDGASQLAFFAIDMCWGMILASSVSYVGYLVGQWLD